MDIPINYSLPAYRIQNGRGAKEVIIGGSAMYNLFTLVNKLAQRNIHVLLFGETGTGKELIARAIHYNKEGSQQLPFLAVNCAALNEGIFESTLFGHKKGSFTGAHKDQVGLVAAAEGGTLFLDEIGDMTLSLQARVLRLLQEKEITPIGSNTPIPIDFRVIAATNKDLGKEIRAGNFRADLYYRISEYPVFIPTLRQRKEDISLLIDYFLAEYNILYNGAITGCDQEARAALEHYDWPGNIRELESVIKRAFVHKTVGTFSRSDLLFDSEITSFCLAIESDVTPDTRLTILREGAQHGTSQVEMGKQLDCTPTNVRILLIKHDLHNLWKEKMKGRKQTVTLKQIETPQQKIVNVLFTLLYQKAKIEDNKPVMATVRYKTNSFIGKNRLLVDYDTALAIFTHYYTTIQSEQKYSILGASRQFKVPRTSILEIFERAHITLESNLRRTPLHVHGRIPAALSLDIPFEDTAYFLGISSATVTFLFKRSGKKSPPTTPLGGKRWYQFTYRKASQTFEATDLGYTPAEIAELLDIPYNQVKQYLIDQKVIRSKLITVLQTLYPEQTHTVPYLEGRLRSIVHPSK